MTADQVLNLLDYPKYFELNKIPLPDNRDGIFERLAADEIIENDVGGKLEHNQLGGDFVCQTIVRYLAFDRPKGCAVGSIWWNKTGQTQL